MQKSAREAGIKKLYHYDRFEPDYLEDLLINRRFHCADLSNLNDPWDCRPWFQPEAMDDPRVAEEFVQWVFAHTPEQPVSTEEEAATRQRLRIDPEYRNGIVDEFSRNFLKMIPGRWGIYCLTPYPDSILMWSHYADDHKGICLEYSTEDELFAGAREVEYLSSYPAWTPQAIMGPSMPHVLLTKSDAWRDEHEFRIIGMAENVEREIKEHPLIMQNGFLQIPNGALTSLIVGCEAREGDIVELARKYDANVPIKRAVRARAQFRLQLEAM